MADEPTDAPGGDGASEEDKEGRHDTEYLCEHARSLLGCPRHVAAGALAAEGRKTHTIEQARDAVRRFRKRRVEPDDGAPGAEE